LYIKLDIYDNLDIVYKYFISAYGKGNMKHTLVAVLFMVTLNSSVNAELLNIGTATYSGSDYNLIYDTDDELTWLDYSNSGATYPGSLTWAASLNNSGVLTINLDEGYTASWDSSEWRLAGNVDGFFSANPQYIYSSEMEGLYYDELGNELNDTSLNFGDFNHLLASTYHMSADTALTAQIGLSFSPRFNFSTGVQDFYSSSINGGIYGMAVLPGSVIPEPASIGLLGLVSGGIYFARRFFIT
jgi:hypothetical protein